MTKRQPVRGEYLVAEHDQPLIAIPVEENGREVTYSVVDDAVADAVLPRSVEDALSLAGAWSDLDWDETVAALDLIRHESRPTPPIDDLDDL